MRIAGHAIAAIALAAALSACAPSALSTARSQIDAANYPAARRELVALSARTDLSASERREVKDDLCLCDFKIGRPTYTLAEQRGVCLEASNEPGSQSGSIVAQIDEAQRIRDAQDEHLKFLAEAHVRVPEQHLAAVCVFLRLMAIYRGWRVPVARWRPDDTR